MRAALLTAWRAPLELAEIPEPECPADGVVLSVLACGVCRSDWHGWTGADPDIQLPHVPGHEFCGTVIETGPATRWRTGDRVIAPFILACGRCPDCAAGNQTVCARQAVPGFTLPGAFAERIAVPHADANLAALPEGMDPAVAAALGCRVTTAWQALTGPGRLGPGEWLAVHGAGGVGLAAIMLAVAMGARVVAVDPVAEKRALACRLGAEAALDPFAVETGMAVREITGGGAHVSLDALGTARVAAASLASLRPLGRHVQIGMPAGADTAWPLPMELVYGRQLSIHGTRGMPGWRFPSLFSLLATGRVPLEAMVTRRIGLGEVTAELAAMDGPTPAGVAVVTRFG